MLRGRTFLLSVLAISLGLFASGCGGPSDRVITASPTTTTEPTTTTVIPTTTTTVPPTTTTQPERKFIVRASRSKSVPRRSSHRGYATWYECAAAVENGGSYGRSSNPSHFGRYQFSKGSWVRHGGDPAHWGNASPAEQDRVFGNAVASGASSEWTPYDGCG